jgi:putative ABC transport system permease protein
MWRRLQFWRRRVQEENELDEELRAHLAIEIQRRVAHGEDPATAAEAARQAFGNLTAIREHSRESWGWAAVDRFSGDIRFGLRMVGKTPMWTTVITATLMLGVGLSTAVFSLVYSVVLQPLPYAEPERLMALWSTGPGALSRYNVIAANWKDWRAQSTLFADFLLTRPVANFNLTRDGEPERLQGARTSGNLTSVLGVQPLLGRYFTEREALEDARVAVLSYWLWQRRFGGDPNIIGRWLQLNGAPFEVIGVMPPAFRYPTRAFELWTPLFIPQDQFQTRFGGDYYSIGRLKPGVTRAAAQEEMSAIMRRLQEMYPASNGASQIGALVEPLLETTVGQTRPILWVLLAATGCLLLIGCLNLAVLFIARVTSRRKELAMRAALGAGSGRLARQILAEAFPLGLAGALGGVLLAWTLVRLSLPWLPEQMPRAESIGLHLPVLAFAVLMSIAVVLLAALLPSRFASKSSVRGGLHQNSRSVTGLSATRNALVTAQVAIALVLVFGGGLFVRSLAALLAVSPGFRSEGVLTMHLAVTRAKYREDPQVAEFYRRITSRVMSIKGVTAAGVVNRLPMAGSQVNPVEFEERIGQETSSTDSRSATPEYFAAMGIPLIRGRYFTDRDTPKSTRVGILDERLAREVFGSRDPIGKRFRFGLPPGEAPWVEIVGVVGHVLNESLDTDPRPQAYWPETQRTQDRGALVVRTIGDPASFTSAVLQQIHAEDPDQPVFDVRTMSDWVDRTLELRNLMTGLVSLYAGASLLLACLGLYGVISYSTGLRMREFGIRMALGAQAVEIRKLVLGQAGKLAVTGAAVGIVLTWPVARTIQSQLYGVSGVDATVLTGAVALLLIVCLLAALSPARRAGRSDPAVTLRSE